MEHSLLRELVSCQTDHEDVGSRPIELGEIGMPGTVPFDSLDGLVACGQRWLPKAEVACTLWPALWLL
jgi:hypothetical protein